MRDPEIWNVAERSVTLAEEIKPMLAGKGNDMQGAVLGELVATWLGGYDPEIRELVFEMWKDVVFKLTEISTPWPSDSIEQGYFEALQNAVAAERERAALERDECNVIWTTAIDEAVAAERERGAEIARLEGARAAMTDDPCAVPLERMAQRIEAAIREGRRGTAPPPLHPP